MESISGWGIQPGQAAPKHAGSTITKDVKDDVLAVARCCQVDKEAVHKAP